MTSSETRVALRALHMDVIKIALSDPLYLECWGPFGDPPTTPARRQHMYTNLIISHWQLMWQVGELNEKHLRVLAQDLFAGKPGQQFWARMGDVRVAVEDGDSLQDFHRIMQDEYDKALPES